MKQMASYCALNKLDTCLRRYVSSSCIAEVIYYAHISRKRHSPRAHGHRKRFLHRYMLRVMCSSKRLEYVARLSAPRDNIHNYIGTGGEGELAIVDFCMPPVMLRSPKSKSVCAKCPLKISEREQLSGSLLLGSPHSSASPHDTSLPLKIIHRDHAAEAVVLHR